MKRTFSRNAAPDRREDAGRSPMSGSVSDDLKASAAGSPVAIVYCEGHFGRIDGKTANGLIRHSAAYRIASVVDSTQAGRDTGHLLDGVVNGIPVVANLKDAVRKANCVPDYLIYGMAPSAGKLSALDRLVILEAIEHGMNIVSGLHEYLGDDPEIAAAAKVGQVSIRDIRKPKPSKNMRLFDGSVGAVGAIRIAVLGTDCAIGKRTTATLLVSALNKAGIRTVLVGTGQTGLMQGARFGIAMDAIPPQFCCGELEGEVVAAFALEAPHAIVIEGQGALSHPAFCTSAFILRGSQPDAVILQHAPRRPHRCDFPQMPMPDPTSEIALIEAFAPTRVIGMTLNHEGMLNDEIAPAISYWNGKLSLPVTDALTRPATELLDMVLSAFPELAPAPTEAGA
ncbi:Uncharacterized conserved protein, NAD-dependent epimerase/dehydratase family [Palleronia salina]|uniref:Uncharacterized conserved protein, NAD-dependent epimerase/dehydratase family n=1 Tax=Palleronia salina TaxID=313368 RepID=A0A1M6M957_9RHOB|nr:DUF1611 domain-containing protein [Palleronia salina]SHJ79962.1 Uncharacterized conserved protein, NAD-dependent epimerase/dehydratase family [Palleronia salina]